MDLRIFYSCPFDSFRPQRHNVPISHRNPIDRHLW